MPISTAADRLKAELSVRFRGLLYCADCGEKLYYSVTNNYKREQAYFFFVQPIVKIPPTIFEKKVMMDMVLESMRRNLLNVQVFEKEFSRKQMECYSKDKKKELAQKRCELNKAKKCIAEIDSLIQKIYEDNAKTNYPMNTMLPFQCLMRKNGNA